MRLLLRLAFWLAAAFAFVMAILPHPPVPAEVNDKVQHMLAFACLALLGSAAYPRWSPLRLGLGLGAFGALIEGVQAIPAIHRDADVRDWIADSIAIVLMLGAVQVWLRLRAKPSDG